MYTFRSALTGIFLFIMVFCIPGLVMGQQPMEIDEIKVIAPYMPTISDAYKINDNPRSDDTLIVQMDFDYSIMPTRIDTRFEVEPISPARMRGEPLAKIYRGHVKAGFGTYTSPYFEAFYNTLRSNEHALGVHVKHLSSSGEIQDYDFSSYSQNTAELFGKRFFRNHTLDAGIGFNRDVVHYYGFRRDDFINDETILEYIDALEKDSVRQHYNHLSASIGFGSNHLDSTRTSFGSSLAYNFFGDRYDATEHNIKFSSNIGRELQQDPTGFGIRHYIDFDVSGDYYNTITPLDTASTAVISLKPRVFSRTRNFAFHIGLDASVQADTASYLRVYPLAGLQVDIVPRVLTAYAQLSGRLEKHSLYSMAQRNPFINTAMPYAFMNLRSEVGGGLKGSLTDYVSYNLSAHNARIDNFPFFVTDTTTILNNQFTTVYDNVRRLNLRAELFAQLGERLSTRIRTDIYQYSQERQLEPWHMPAMEIGLNLKYNIQDKIIITGDAFARDSVYGLIYDEQGNPLAQKIHGFHVDVNLGVEYRYTKLLSVFLNFNNLQNNSLERWINYPSQRFNVLGGLSYSF